MMMWSTKRLIGWSGSLVVSTALTTGALPAAAPVGDESGQWVKVEGQLSKTGSLIADKVESVKADEDLELEGLIQSVDPEARRFSIAGFVVRITPSTGIEDSDRGRRGISDLQAGRRVKVKFTQFDDRVIQASRVRIYLDSTDRDVELQGPLSQVAAGPVLLSVPVQLTDRTRYVNFDRDGFSLLQAPPSLNRLRDDDEPNLPPRQFAGFFIGGKVGLGFDRRSNADLTKLVDDDDSFVRPQARFELIRPLSERLELLAEFEINGDTNLTPALSNQTASHLQVREAYLYIRRVGYRGLSLQVGRQRFRDRREWWYDDRLDAVRLHLRKSRFKFELAAARKILGERTSRSDQLQLITSAQFDLPGRRTVSGYWIKRNDTTRRDEDPIWLGVSSRGRLAPRSEYWVELARMTGRRGNRKLRGWGFDVGGAYRLPWRWRPTVSGGYAYGSGDDDLSDGVDGNFRQTRLNDNSYQVGSLRRYRYYGLVLEPELYNLKIATLDLGFRPSPSWSLNIAYHRYRQVRPSRRLGNSELAIRPRGRDPRLGQEFDVVWAMRKLEHLDLNFFFGVFFPGPGFREGSSTALLVRPEIRFFF